MSRYGQTITWSTPLAPHPFSGDCTSYSARDALTQQLIDDEAGDHSALVLHSRKVAINFEAIVRDSSTDFLDLSTGAQITIQDVSPGVVLCTRAVERWALGQPKTAGISAMQYPDITVDGDGAGTNLNAFTPAPGLSFVHPGDTIIYGTAGLGHASGVVHGLTLEQQLSITEDEPTPDGKITGAATHGYLRTIQLELLVKSTLPAVGTELALTGTLDRVAKYRIVSVTPRYALKRAKMCSIGAVWIPPFGA